MSLRVANLARLATLNNYCQLPSGIFLGCDMVNHFPFWHQCFPKMLVRLINKIKMDLKMRFLDLAFTAETGR